VLAWLAEQVDLGLDDHDALRHAKFAATTLLDVPPMRAMGDGIGLEGRPPYSWDQIDAYEILFDSLAHGAPYVGTDLHAVAAGIRSFARFLGRHGVLDPEASEALDLDLQVWIPRLVRYVANGVWWNRDGGAHPPR
jgi:hypothetical protein